MAEHPGIPSLVGLGTRDFGVFVHGRFIVARLVVGGRARFAVVSDQDFPAVCQAEPTDVPLLSDFFL